MRIYYNNRNQCLILSKSYNTNRYSGEVNIISKLPKEINPEFI